MTGLFCLPLAYAFRSVGPAISALSLIVLFVLGVAIVLLAGYLAGLPGRVAEERGHPRAEAVRVCGWLGLLTGVGWVIAMVWAFATPDAGRTDLTARLDSLDEAVTALESTTAGDRS